MPGQNSAATVYQNRRIKPKGEDAAGLRLFARLSDAEDFACLASAAISASVRCASPSIAASCATPVANVALRAGVSPHGSVLLPAATGSALMVVSQDRRSERVLAKAGPYRSNLGVGVGPGISEMRY